MDVFISADIEGCTGIASFSQCGRPDADHYDYDFARRMMTHDVNAVVRGVRQAGADRIVVKDGHANCKNLLVADLEDGVELISGQGPTRDGMMDGIDESFQAAMLVGYHGRAGLLHAMMEHALVGTLHGFWINDLPAGEILVSAAVAAAYGVPLVLVASDTAGCSEAENTIPGVETVATKIGYAKYMGRLAHETTGRLQRAARSAIERRHEILPIEIQGPVRMRATFRTISDADLSACLEGVKRLDGYSLEWASPSFLEAHRKAIDVFQLSIASRRSQN